MREIGEEEIIAAAADLARESNYYLPEDIQRVLKQRLREEESPVGRDILQQILQNVDIAAEKRMPLCQDTGFAVVFLEIGNEVNIKGDIYGAVNRGVKKGYREGYLRKSIVEHPFRRENTGTNTPAVIHTKLIPGDRLRIIMAPKGAGSENMSRIKMLKPGAGREGVKEFVLQTVEEAGANPCPPLIVGVGIGGTFEKAALLAKQSLLRPLDDSNGDKTIADLEEELLYSINKLGIGPQGLGGTTTALAVKINYFPCHIASLPVAVNLNCHAARHREVTL